MEPKGKTSFIPKQPSGRKRAKPSGGQGLLFLISFIIFLITVAAAGGVYFYKGYLESKIEQKKQYLEKSREAFEVSLLKELKTVDKRIKASEKLLEKHSAPSVIFKVLENNTLKTVSFDSLEYTMKKGQPQLSMTGKARGFDAIALQSDIFGKKELFTNPVFSQMGTNKEGGVKFSFSSPLKKSELLYKNLIKGSSVNTETSSKRSTSSKTGQKENPLMQ